MAKNRKRTKKKSSFNIGRSSSESFVTYERIWANNGAIFIEDKKGTVTTMDTLEACHRAKALNAMLGNPKMDPATRKKNIEFIEKIKEVIFKASAQLENKATPGARIVSNVMSGKTAEGKPLPPLTTEDRMHFIHSKFPMLTQEEISTISNERNLPLQDKIAMMEAINQDRVMDKFKEAERAKEEISK